MQWFFCFFFVSGFCSILYEVIWLRIAMAEFGVTTAMVSLVLSAFMIGLGVGSWGSGLVVRRYLSRSQFPALRLYALMELLIGAAAFIVPYQLLWGRELLRALREASLSSSSYYVPSGIWIGLTLVPWCLCMGATFPFAMAAIRQLYPAEGERSFSYLYLANVLGAAAGTVAPLFLIELYGFHWTLHFSASLNLLLAAGAFSLTLVRKPAGVAVVPDASPGSRSSLEHGSGKFLLGLLFGTGLTSMGVEVVWVRLYTPTLSTVVYAFAAILGLYLVAMYVGSKIYRRSEQGPSVESGLLWIVLGVSVFLAFVTADPRAHLPGILRVMLGIMPFSILVGYITPMIVDQYSQGDPDRAGSAYAVNIAGCVLGPLLAGFVLLPLASERLALCILALPWFVVGFSLRPKSVFSFRHALASPYVIFACFLTVGSGALAFSSKGFEEQYEPRQIRRDNTATVIATGSSRSGKRLLVNGVGITNLTPITKMMVHLPLAFLTHPPQSGLVICFGMGTSHLSMLSWGIRSTAVELVPSVPGLVTFFHPDAQLEMESPLSRVVIDDGRFYLERTVEQYDVITIDPPPPVQAAGSSLLYSKEFYATAKRHLRDGGILQQWLPQGDPVVIAAVTRALTESFTYVRPFRSVEGWGIHFLASMRPIPNLSGAQLAEKLPPDAVRDLMEWGPATNAQEQFSMVLGHELSTAKLIQQAPDAPVLQDDRPVNEYFIVRRLRDPEFERAALRRLLGRRPDL